MSLRVLPAAGMLVALAGCPPVGQDPNDSVVDVALSANITSGPAPLQVLFSAANSASPNGGPFTYAWDFGDGTTSAQVQPTKTFEEPGLYRVRVTVTDGAGETGVESVDIRAAGISAEAVIMTDANAGPAPLLVRFDGAASSAPDDTIRDFFWDFGDGTTARIPAPVHQYTAVGTYTVTLRVVTGGGVEDSETTEIRVDASSSSLLFEAGDRATLPVTGLANAGVTETLSVELWVKPATTGGTLLAVGSNTLVLALSPAADEITLQLGDDISTFTAENLANQWRHLAVTYNAQMLGATVYLDGEALGTAPVADPPERTLSAITLGGTYAGGISDVRLWNVTLSDAQVVGAMDRRLTGGEPGLLRYWKLDDRTGQFLADTVGVEFGVLGQTGSVEPADPTWTTDAPPVF